MSENQNFPHKSGIIAVLGQVTPNQLTPGSSHPIFGQVIACVLFKYLHYNVAQFM